VRLRGIMTNNRMVWSTVRGLLMVSACLAAHAVLGAEPVASEIRSWNIPAEDAAAALRDFGVQSGVAISAEAAVLEGKRLNAVTGSLTVDKALQMLVAGSGLKYVYDPTGRAVTLAPAKPVGAEKPDTLAGRRSDPSAASAPPNDVPDLLEEIVVTARKRAENLQDVPISAQVVSGQTLADYSIKSLSELSQSLPGIQMSVAGSGGQFFVRGIGTGAGFMFDQSVGTYIDDIYHGRTRIADEAFLDLDRIEVLKGPQSTFFGNNSVAGALNIVTAKPTDTFDGNVRALYGQYGQYAGEGMLNIPLNPDLAVRIAAIGDGLSGWAQDPYAGHDQPDQNNKAGRITFFYHPSDEFDATFKVEGSTNHDTDGSVVGDCPPPAPFAAPPGTSNFCAQASKLGYPLRASNLADTTNAGQGVNLSTFEDVLTLHRRIGEDTLTSVSGFYNYHYTQDVDSDGTPIELLNLQTAEAYHQFSQEFRLASPQGETLEYLVGAYYQDSRLTGHSGNITYFYLDPTVLKSYPALAADLPLASSNPSIQNEHDYALFGSLGWNVTDQIKFGTGLRGSWVYKSASAEQWYGTGTDAYGGVVPLAASLQTVAANLLGAPKPAWAAANSYNSLMPSAELDYKFVPSIMLYGTYARGFLAGVPTDVGYVPAGTNVATPPVLPETVNDYELGFKSTFLDDHLRVDAGVYRSVYSNLQVSSNALITTATSSVLVAQITNAASSRSQGVELSSEWVFDGLRFQTVVTYLDARYLSYPGVTLTAAQSYCHAPATAKTPGCLAEFPNGVGATQDLSGDPTNFAPTWNGSLKASYTAALPRGYHFITEAIVNASTRYLYGNAGTADPEQTQPGYARLDARLSLEAPNGRWAADIIVKNATDKLVVASGNFLAASNGSTLLQVDQPRNVVVQGRYRW
jgi:iron complex outermembrane recepter protein